MPLNVLGRFCWFLLASVWLLLSALSGGVSGYSGKVLLVSMDGFRWDYVKKVSGLKYFPQLAGSGASVDYVNNSFATVTFPNHYTIVTGLHEENHGVVANNMYDPDSGSEFHLTVNGPSSTDGLWWKDAEPLWITAVKHGLKAGVIQWPGAASEIHGYRPTMWRPYEYVGSMTFPQRVTLALDWLQEHDMDLLALYFYEPDYTGHAYGPDSPEVADKVREMDGILGLILNGLHDRQLSDTVNVIVTSDHGMTGVDMQNKIIDLYSVVDRELIARVPESGPVTAILPVEGREEEVMAALRKVEHITPYRKSEVPERYHYRDHRRIMPIIVVADEGWELAESVDSFREWGAKGDHGYDNQLPSMKPIFFASGPDFCKGVHSTSIRSVDIYPLVCELLGLPPLPNNGSLGNTARFLTSSHACSAAAALTSSAWSVTGVLMVFLAPLCTML